MLGVCALRGTLFLSAGLALVQPCASQTWTATGSLATTRYSHTATLLPNGKVLVAGGNDNSGSLASAELYDPASGTWTATGSLATPRRGHTATLLPNGKVLVASGLGTNNFYQASAELYDPASGTWTATGSVATARFAHTATLLPNGKVLIAGGSNGVNGTASAALTSAELHDPASGTWTASGSLGAGHSQHTATLLPDGKVVVAGGSNGSSGSLASAELYDPASGTWTVTGSLAAVRNSHTATLLPNGKTLVAGGSNGSVALASAELYDPASGTWTATGSVATARFAHTATLLPNGKVLVTGGPSNSGLLASAELFDPASETWTATGSLATARYLHAATLLPNGDVLVAGGVGTSGILASAELYGPGPPMITSPLVATGTVGLPFTYQFTASGATLLEIPGSVAPGLTFNTSLGAITGIPTTAGIFQVGLSATNSAGTTNATLTITVQPAPFGTGYCQQHLRNRQNRSSLQFSTANNRRQFCHALCRGWSSSSWVEPRLLHGLHLGDSNFRWQLRPGGLRNRRGGNNKRHPTVDLFLRSHCSDHYQPRHRDTYARSTFHLPNNCGRKRHLRLHWQ